MDAHTATQVLISLLVKPALMLALLWLVYALVRRQSAAFKHFVLLLGVLALLALPLLAVLLPGIDWHLVPWLGRLAQSLDQQLLVWLQLLPAWLDGYGLALMAVYVFIASWILYYRALGWLALAYQSRRAQTITSPELCALRDQLCQLLDIARPVALKTSTEVDSPQMWGWWRPVIVLPRSALLWDSDKQLSVLIHELGHVARRDWPSSQLVAITCAIFWFLPPLWWLAHRLYDQAEMACDDMIYRLRDKHLAYAQSLLQLAGGEPLPADDSALGMLGHSSIYWRIQALLDQRRARQPVALEAGQYWVLGALVLLLFMASIQVIPLPRLAGDAQEWVDLPLPPPPPASAAAPTEQLFSWQELRRLRAAPSSPEPVIEQVHIRQPYRPNPADLPREPLALPSTSELPLSRIQVRGYLPLHLEVPEYPRLALERGLEGRVVVEFAIHSDGQVLEPRIIERPNTRLFDKAVLAALQKSRYQPQLIDGQPVVLRGVTEEFIFQLEPPPNRRRP